MAFDEYFEGIDFFLDKKIGVTMYNSNESDFEAFTEQLDSNDINYESFKASDLLNRNNKIKLQYDEFQYLVFYQDVSISELKLHIDKIVNEYIFPTYFYNIPIALFSKIEKTKYFNIQIDSGLIHQKINEVESLLLIEQLHNLLEPNSIELNKDTSFKKNEILTPIEKIIKVELENRKLTYKPQVKLGRHYVDFLVEHNNKKLIVECDGRDYHNPHKDKERDKELEKFGINILRLSGSEIFHNPDKCIEKIINGLTTSVKRAEKRIDKDLDESQKSPLNHIAGPCRVLAPAGSGKTKTLVNRISNLINQGIDESKILALAFNKKAADEMTKRLDERDIKVSKKIKQEGVAVKTFHSFGYEIINEYLKWRFVGERETLETRNLLRKAFTLFVDIPGYKINDAIDKMLEALRRAKMELVPIEDVTVEIDDKIYPFQDIFYKYLELQRNNSFFNFDDMIYLTLRILLDNGIARKTLQNRFQYILVDEFQDLTEAQILLMQILSLPFNNLFIVGDDDQMIYGWRGAKTTHIINFPIRYRTSKDFTLSTNYRCTKKVVKHSTWLINYNKNRVPKDIKPRINAEQGELTIKISENIYEQAIEATEWIKSNQKTKKQNWKDFAILYRYHEYQYPIAMILDSYQIPHSPVNSFKLFLKNPGKDLYAYLTVLLHPEDAKKEDFERILKKPNKYFSNDLISNAIDWDSFIELWEIPSEEWRRVKIKDFIDKIVDIKSELKYSLNSPEKLVQEIFDVFSFKEYYKDEAKVVNEVEKAGDDIIIDVIISVSKLFKSTDDFYSQVYKAINEPYESLNPFETKGNNEVHLTTIHSTKGNEYPNVVYFNLSEAENNLSDSELEEERRVCYVGVTRAIKNILITTTQDKYSKYLLELIRNPLYKSVSNIQLNNLFSQAKQEEQSILGKIEFTKKEIDKMLNDFPELKGESLNVKEELIGIAQRKKIEILENKYPEVNGLPLKTDYSIFKNYFINLRLKRIDKAKLKINMLTKEVNELVQNQITLRRNNINSTAKRIEELNDSVTRLTNNELVICSDKTHEIKSEIEFRELIPLKN